MQAAERAGGMEEKTDAREEGAQEARGLLHAGLDASGAWKAKGWEGFGEPGWGGQMQHCGFLLRGEILPLCFPQIEHRVKRRLAGLPAAGALREGTWPQQLGQGASERRDARVHPPLCEVFGEPPNLLSASSPKNSVT